ncbi:MAG: gamma-glutamyl-gamma-aminobutyrate hydrolase family protein [Dehalococcoidia bacterium]|nr:MAG: gamma-glutamyl-gamma-aminobutyrate hydrolase family protein [Dehalococcoidia bacterium]
MSTQAARPRILVTVAKDVVEGRWDDYSAAFGRAVEAAGGEAIPIFYGRYSPDDVPPHDGLVTIGGVDVDPAQYGERPHPHLERTIPARDVAEIALTRLALNERRPLLAICRGAQVMNVACGGSLLQHIEEREPHHGPQGSDESGWHDVIVTPGSLLARIAGDGPLRVNSRHHQAVTPERLAPGLVESGRTETAGLTVLEAIEAPGHPFALGVQWHPERAEMLANPAFHAASTALFEAFVVACVAERTRG